MDIQNLDDLEVELPAEFGGLPVFVVGGAVRDAIRGVESHDTDLMVAEVAPSEMERRGFREIDSPNNDTFAVFQDSLGREVAIAREERSTGEGHNDFIITPVEPDIPASEAVKLDLKRRDFTVNAMAYDVRWDTLHDPHGGVQDLEAGVIRAVDSNAFQQDPLRIVRGARFAARLNADIEPTTKSLMEDMVGQLDSLPPERIRIELEKSLVQADKPSRFFEILDEVGALKTTFPELAELTHVPAGPEQHHSEGSAFRHTLMVLDEMKERCPNDELALLMALAHDLGKGTTPAESLPHHYDHESRGVDVVREMADRLSMSKKQRKAMEEASRFHMKMLNIGDLRASTVVDMWEDMRQDGRMIDLAVADSAGRIPEGDANRGDMIRRLGAARAACREWTGQRLIEEGYSPDEMGGEEFGNLLHQKRVERMRELEQ